MEAFVHLFSLSFAFISFCGGSGHFIERRWGIKGGVWLAFNVAAAMVHEEGIWQF